jgi:chitinase
VSYNKVSSIYKNPSRTTPRTTTTTASFLDEIDTSDLEQEDPKVIKELIELIKKAGGIEELEKQINIQEQTSLDTSNVKSDQKATTPATTINKSLVDKIKNRASLFKSRPPLFNGASQPEKVAEQKASTSTQSSAQAPAETPKKYNSINRFSRPQSQNAGIDKIPESDAVLIEKPQYTSIARRKPVKPEVITENDYNNDPDRATLKATNTQSGSVVESNKKYASISRPRVPVQVVESDEDETDEDDLEDEEEDIPLTTTTTAKAPSKYINLARRRSTVSPIDTK